jgi:hypothetical protein
MAKTANDKNSPREVYTEDENEDIDENLNYKTDL